jgi:hypothetical protein
MAGRRGVWAVLLLALLVRGAVLLAFDGGPSRPLEGDEKGYAAAAGSLARGDGFGFEVAGFSPRTGLLERRRLVAFRAPLLPALLAPVHLVSGGAPGALRGACVLLGALAAPLALLLAGRLGGARAAWIAGLAVALWPSQAWLSARVLSEPLDAVLLLASADLLLRHRHGAGGAALGLAVLCRPGGLPAAVLAVLAVASAQERGRRLRAALLAGGACLLVVAPWVVRNHLFLGSPVLATTSGVTLLGGNCDAALEAAHPGKWVPPARAWTGDDPPDMGMYGWGRLDEAASSARFAAAARDWAAEDPLRAARLAGWKAVRFFDPDTRSEKGDAGLKAWAGWLSWGPAGLLVLLALAAGARLREPEWRLGLALLAGHLAVALLAYGDARMRAPVVPVLIALLAAPLLAGGAPLRGPPSAPDTVGP